MLACVLSQELFFLSLCLLYVSHAVSSCGPHVCPVVEALLFFSFCVITHSGTIIAVKGGYTTCEGYTGRLRRRSHYQQGGFYRTFPLSLNNRKGIYGDHVLKNSFILLLFNDQNLRPIQRILGPFVDFKRSRIANIYLFYCCYLFCHIGNLQFYRSLEWLYERSQL